MKNKVVLCRVRVCSIGYGIPYRAYRKIGWRYEKLTEFTNVEYAFESLIGITELTGSVWDADRETVPAIRYFFKSIPAHRVPVNILYGIHRSVG